MKKREEMETTLDCALEKLNATNPTVHACMQYYREGYLSKEYAVLMAMNCLAEQNNCLQEQLVRSYAWDERGNYKR